MRGEVAANAAKQKVGAQTYVLVGNDLDRDDVASRLKDLTENILSQTRIQPTNVKSTLVRFRGCATHVAACRGRRHDAARHGGADGGGNGVGVLRNYDRREGRRRHMALRGLGIALSAIVVAGSASLLRRRRNRGGRGLRLRHFEMMDDCRVDEHLSDQQVALWPACVARGVVVLTQTTGEL